VNLDALYRREYGHILATIIRAAGDFTLAEDVVQEAFAAAHTRWVDGLPPNPVGWLVTTARNKAIDQLRRRMLAQSKHEEMIALVHTGRRHPGAARCIAADIHLLPTRRWRPRRRWH